jgi:hypothetical protein
MGRAQLWVLFSKKPEARPTSSGDVKSASRERRIQNLIKSKNSFDNHENQGKSGAWKTTRRKSAKLPTTTSTKQWASPFVDLINTRVFVSVVGVCISCRRARGRVRRLHYKTILLNWLQISRLVVSRWIPLSQYKVYYALSDYSPASPARLFRWIKNFLW